MKSLMIVLLVLVAMPASAAQWKRETLERHAETIAGRYGVPADTLKAICERESSWNPRAVGSVGEIGLCQLRPQTVALMKGATWRKDLNENERIKLIESELFDPRANLAWAAQYLRWMMREAKGDITLAIAAYNAGPGVIRYVHRVKDTMGEGEIKPAPAGVPTIAPVAHPVPSPATVPEAAHLMPVNISIPINN